MRTMDPGYPKPITVWKGIPDSPQGAFVDKANGRFAHCLHDMLTFPKNTKQDLKIRVRNVVWLKNKRKKH